MADEPRGGGEKTEAPTAKKLLDSKKKGDVLQSKELGAALVVMAGAITFIAAGWVGIETLKLMLQSGLTISPDQLSNQSFGNRSLQLVGIFAPIYSGWLLILMLAAVATPILLGSFGFRISAMKPKPDKLSPIAGLKRMFGVKGLMELGKSLAKVVLLGSIGLALVVINLPELFGTGKLHVDAAASQFGHLFLAIFAAISFGLFLIAGIDVPFQIVQRGKRLRMTKQEVKDENKETEGSPEAKAAQRTRQQQIISQSARKAMDEATVLLTNPTHFAVVLRYRPGRDSAPMVLARGRGEIAQAMRELADEKSVPMLQYPELTRAIYFTSPVGGTIDERLYLAVATILAFLFRLDADLAGETDRPEIETPSDVRFDGDGKRIEPD